MCFKCDTGLTQEEWDHYCKKIASNALYGLQGVVTWGRDQPYEVLYPLPKSRFRPLTLMVRKMKSKRLTALYERVVRKFWCGRFGHEHKLTYNSCMNCNKQYIWEAGTPLGRNHFFQDWLRPTKGAFDALQKFGVQMDKVAEINKMTKQAMIGAEDLPWIRDMLNLPPPSRQQRLSETKQVVNHFLEMDTDGVYFDKQWRGTNE